MTIRVPRPAVIAVLALIAAAAIGLGGYAYGRHSRDADVKPDQSAKRLAEWKRAEAIHAENTWRLMHNLCEELIRIPPAVGSFSAADCEHTGFIAPRRPFRTVYEQDLSFLSGVLLLCQAVKRIQAPGGDLTGPDCRSGRRDVRHPDIVTP